MAVASGSNTKGQCNIPALVGDITYTQVAAGDYHTVLLRSDGTVVACGQLSCHTLPKEMPHGHEQCDIPALDGNLKYAQVAAGHFSALLLRSDGIAVSFNFDRIAGITRCDQVKIPALVGDLTYTQVAACGKHVVLLRSDGTVASFYNNFPSQRGRWWNERELPAFVGDLTCTQVAAGSSHTVVLRSDGTAVACGSQSTIPALAGDLIYTQVAAGDCNTLLLRSDGTVVACGANEHGNCNIPALSGDQTYTEIAAGSVHSVLLRSDGAALACGEYRVIPSLQSWLERVQFRNPRVRYVANSKPVVPPNVVLQAFFSCHADGNLMHLLKLSGEELCSFRILATDKTYDMLIRVRHEQGQVDVVLPDGQLLSQIILQDPLTTLGCGAATGTGRCVCDCATGAKLCCCMFLEASI